jgi:methionyl-tRNA formyltransferase
MPAHVAAETLMTSPRPISIVYFGTPTYAVPALRTLAAAPRYDVALVVTQPDRPAGRGNRLTPPPVKLGAEELGIPVYQPDSLRDESARQPLVDAEADLFVVAAFGLIFGRKTLAIPTYGCLNLHASLLPAYRGASPIPAAILSGDAATGVSLMVMEQGLDTGPVVARSLVPIQATETTESLTARLGHAAADLVVAAALPFVRREGTPAPQDPTEATIVRQLVKADGWLDWLEDATELDRRVRAMWPWPRAWTTFRGEPLQIHAATPIQEDISASPGTPVLASGNVFVACGVGSLRLDIVQSAGGKPVSGYAWATGRRICAGEGFGTVGAPPQATPLIAKV